MEESDNGQCSVVYYCPGSHDAGLGLFRSSSPLPVTSAALHTPAPHDRIYSNVCRLLDEDQGGFDQVFVGALAEKCLDSLAAFTKLRPTVVLLELEERYSEDIQTLVLDFLHTFKHNVRESCYDHHAMPFVLLTGALPSDLHPDHAREKTYLSAGALATIPSPLCSTSIHSLVGQIKELTTPSARILGTDMPGILVSSIRSGSKPSIASHRPDEFLSPQRKIAVEEAVSHWQFPAHTFDMDELTYGALSMLEHVLRNPALEPYRLPRQEIITFLLAARRQYRHERQVAYHNWRHAVDVTQSLYCFLCDVGLCPPLPTALRRPREVNALERLLSPLDALTLLVSAIGHDVGHPGVNNAFLVASNHQLARLYNDKSVLENYHCAAYSQLLHRHWPVLSRVSQFRPTMISTILATDMQRHFEYMGYLSDLKQRVEKSGYDLSDWSEKDREHTRELIMALLIKAADISNVARPFEIAAQWAKILSNEFSRQGELEDELQIPTCLFGGPPDKEDLLAAAQSQKGFLNLFGLPLFRGISEIMPNVSCSLSCLEANDEAWEQKIAEEKSRRAAAGRDPNSPKTFGSVDGPQVEEARRRKRASEPVNVPVIVPQTPTSPHQRQPALDRQGSPVAHPASDQRRHLRLGIPPPGEEKRASAPVLWSSPLSPTAGASSRRSSKDVALNQLQELNAIAQQNFPPAESRRGSADAGWQLHQNYPSSRRGSKDESLTTILVTSQSSSPASRSVPASPKFGKASKRQGPAKSTATAGRSLPLSMSQQSVARTGAQNVHVPTLQPALPGVIASPASERCTGTEEDSLFPSRDSSSGLDGTHHSSAPTALPHTPPETLQLDSARGTPRLASADSGGSQSGTPESQVRSSRSRSRLRGLKFWKKRRDISGVEDAAVATPTVPPLTRFPST